MLPIQNPKRIIVLGGGYTGLKAAMRLARKLRGQPIEVLLVNGADHFVERVRLHQLGVGQPLQKIAFRSLLRGTGVQFMQGWVSQVMPEQKAVAVQTGDGMKRLGYDYLVYALGSFIDTASVPGVDEYALSVSTEATTIELQQRLPEIASHGGRVVVCGGGLTGIESATEIAETYPNLKVTLITDGDFGEQLSKRGQKYLREWFAKRQIEVIDQAAITRVTPIQVEYEGGAVPFDVCLWSAGFAVPSLAQDAGLQVNGRSQIVVDQHLRSTSHADIYGIGDAASLEIALDFPTRMACATGLPMATYAADHIIATLKGDTMSRYRFAYYGRCISLGRHDGIVQWVERDDTPREYITTGKLAAQIKEAICRYAANMATQSERWLPGGARWTGARPVDAATGQVQTSP
jgi:NADH dehydrogenase FAD-containing subunit